ncbi:MAG TPA: GNAT family protein [Candidatus Nanoarchaeia archaeon]|nr:GNAT family protein [Candidatus Nanoarchaeia archaeon]
MPDQHDEPGRKTRQYAYGPVRSLKEIIAFANELSLSNDPNSQFVRYCHADRDELEAFLKDEFNSMSALYDIDQTTGKRKIIALCSISRPRDPRLGHAIEITFAVHPSYRGRGVGSSLVKKQIEVLGNAQPTLGIARVDAYVIPENKVTRSLLSRLGFELEGVEHDKLRFGGKSYDVIKYIKYLAESEKPQGKA